MQIIAIYVTAILCAGISRHGREPDILHYRKRLCDKTCPERHLCSIGKLDMNCSN
jgi:hypothetical protein